MNPERKSKPGVSIEPSRPHGTRPAKEWLAGMVGVIVLVLALPCHVLAQQPTKPFEHKWVSGTQPQKRGGPKDVSELCEGFTIFVVNQDDTVVPGNLKCNGKCPDETQCKPQTSQDGNRQWCGCPDLPEGKFCHLVRIKTTPPGGGAPFWAYACEGPCPAGSQDMCKPTEHVLPAANPGEKKRIMVKCECLGVGE